MGTIDFYRMGAEMPLRSFFYSGLFLGRFILLFIADRHRLPFDFVEAESELVRGYNVEYGGWGFALLIVAEYRRLLILGQVVSLYLFGSGGVIVIGGGLSISIIFLSLRGTMPRFNLIKFISHCWLFFLPLSFLFFLMSSLFLLVASILNYIGI